jgi:hypothetical protein
MRNCKLEAPTWQAPRLFMCMSFRRSRRFLNDLWDNGDEAMTAAVGAALARETVLR